MMPPTGNWVCYRTVFSAEAPIHIGWHRLGLIERTRYYIPARAIWGALIASLAPIRFPDAGVPGMYQETTAEFAASVRFTCFFPSAGPNSEVWRPRYDPSAGLMYGNMPAADFESRFVFSQTSATLNPATFSALDGALHESEYLCFTSPNNAPGALHFIGYLIFKDSLAADLEKGISTVSIGAERNYGWGRLRLRSFQRTTAPLFGEFPLTAGAVQNPSVRNNAEASLPAHLLHQAGKTNLAGDLELVGGRDWSPRSGSGRDLGELKLCWAPGSQVHANGTAFEIDHLGIWTAQ